jgi:hypothetical protein
MDGLDPDRRDVLLHLVPAPARIVIVKGYARRYRAACARRWGPDVNVAPVGSSLKHDFQHCCGNPTITADLSDSGS